MMPAQVAFREPPATADGLRTRKKLKTRRAIQDAALALFAEQGYEATSVNDIAERADVSTTTFFRYFRSKGEVILSDHSERLPAMQRAILERPDSESDLAVVRHAIQHEWVAEIDPQRTALQARAIGTSHVLRGASYDIGLTWLAAIAGALARRHALEVPDQRCRLVARVALAVFGNAVDSWMLDDTSSDLSAAVDQGFDALAALAAPSTSRA